MTDAPSTLLVMRLADMVRVHPQQDNSRTCDRCGEQVGIYPSGQEVLRKNPSTEIVCSVCAEQDPPPTLQALAPGALHEPFESVRAKR